MSQFWPPRIYFSLPETKTTSTSITGRRYGYYFWLTLSLGRFHLNVFPKHTRGFWSGLK